MSTYTWSIPTGETITGNTYIKDTDDKLAETIDDLVDFVNGEGVHENEGLTYDLVTKNTSQVITGAKTFTEPISANDGLVGNVTGALTGNADTASKWATARTITALGAVSGSVTIDGSSNVNITTTATSAITENFVPSGGIIMFTGTTAPTGWYLCNGQNGTPDLRDRFVVGSGSTYSNGNTGGSKDAVIVAHSHQISGTANSAGEHDHDGYSNLNLSYSAGGGRPNDAPNGRATSGRSWSTLDAGEHTHNVTGTAIAVGEAKENKNLPPYYALAYIMKG